MGYDQEGPQSAVEILQGCIGNCVLLWHCSGLRFAQPSGNPHWRHCGETVAFFFFFQSTEERLRRNSTLVWLYNINPWMIKLNESGEEYKIILQEKSVVSINQSISSSSKGLHTIKGAQHLGHEVIHGRWQHKPKQKDEPEEGRYQHHFL